MGEVGSGNNKQNLRFLMPGIYMDFAAVRKSSEIILRRARFDIDRIIPGHDFEVLQRESFPQNAGGRVRANL